MSISNILRARNITYLFVLIYLYKIGFALYLLVKLAVTDRADYDRFDFIAPLAINFGYVGLYSLIPMLMYLLLYRFFAGEISSRPFKVLYITFIASFIIELIVGRIINSY